MGTILSICVICSAKFTNTGLLILIPTRRSDNEAVIERYARLGVEMVMIDKDDMARTFPMFNSDVGEFDNTGETEFVPKPMTDETFLLETAAGYFEPVQGIYMNMLYILMIQYDIQFVRRGVLSYFLDILF